MEYRLAGALTRFRSGVYRLDLFPYGSINGLEFLEQHSQPFIVVTAFSYFLSDEPTRTHHIADLARRNRIPFQTHAKHEVLAIAREDLRALVAGAYFWNIICWDAGHAPLPSELAEQAALVARAGLWRPRTAALQVLGGAQLYLWSHDDAYFQFEARRPEAVRQVYADALANAVAKVAEGAPGQSVKIEPAPDTLIDHLWQTVPSFELRIAPRSGKPGRVRVRFGERRSPAETADFQAVGSVEYDLASGRWVHRYH